MPSASSAKLEKQASSEASDPLKQGITLVEHKIRNLVKKKARLDSYREIQKSGKELDADQKQSLLKYDEVSQNLAFAQDLSKQLSGIVQESTKQQKRKEKKEAYEREQQETAKVKEILIIQDVLASMGSDTVREDFLAGRNKAIKLTETELQYLDELFSEVSPKREPEEGQPSFPEQAQNAAKHLLSIVEGKDKEIVGTKYNTLRDLIEKINNCGYFDHADGPETASQIVGEEMKAPEIHSSEPVGAEPEEEPEPVPSSAYQPTDASANLEPVATQEVVTAGLFISQRPMADVLTNVMGPGPTTFNFIQESELESPDVGGVTAPVPTAMPIPTQTFTNANFAPAPAAVASVYAPPTADVVYAPPVAPSPAQYSPVPPVPAQQFEPSNTFQNTSQAGSGDWNDSTEQNNDWAMQVEQSEEKNQWSEPAQSDEWGDNSNDGFQTAGRGGGRGGRARGGDRGRSGPRGGRGGYQNGRGNYSNNQNGRGGGGGGGNYYRNNEGTNNYYQNGYQPRGEGERGYRDNREGGQRRGGPRGGGQDRGAPRSDRGGPRGGGGRGAGNPRGANRGNRQ